MPAATNEVRTLLGESIEARRKREKRNEGLDRTERRAGGALGRRTFDIFKAIEGSDPEKKKFSDGDLLAFKIIWDLVDHSHEVLRLYEERGSDFYSLFKLCNRKMNYKELGAWYIYRNIATYEVKLVEREPRSTRNSKIRQIELRLKGLTLHRDQKVMEKKAAKLGLDGYEKLEESDSLQLEITINVLEQSIVDLELRLIEEVSKSETDDVDKLLSQPQFSGFRLQGSIEAVLEEKKYIKNSHLDDEKLENNGRLTVV